MVETAHNNVNKLTCAPKNGISKPKLNKTSYDERSDAHKNGSCLNVIDAGKNLNKAYQIGICNNIGRQPPNGLTPYSLYIFMVSICCFCMSSLYF